MKLMATDVDDPCVHAGVVAPQRLIRESLTFLLREASIDVGASVRSFADLDHADEAGVITAAVVWMPDDSGVAVVSASAGRSWCDPVRLEQPVVVLDWDALPRDLVRLVRCPVMLRSPVPSGPGILRSWDRSIETRVGLSDLTDREISVLALLAAGRSATESARALGISPHTVRTHVANILRKLGVHSRLEAVAATRELLDDELVRRDVAV